MGIFSIGEVMQILGKVLGGLFGFMFGGPWGAIFGLFLGHLFDRRAAGPWGFAGNNEEVQALFFKAVFSCMGHLAKSDGHITPSEINAAKDVMRHLQLNESQTKRAMELFYRGKSADFDYVRLLEELKSVCAGRRNLLRMFIQLQLQAAYADGELASKETNVLLAMAQALGFSRFEFDQLHAMYRAQAAFRSGGFYRQQGQYQRSYQSNQNQFTSQRDLNNAYKILGVSKTDSKETIKKAYRKLMNQYHPDKLVAKGLPESMMKAATEKTQEIKQAYELICQHVK